MQLRTQVDEFGKLQPQAIVTAITIVKNAIEALLGSRGARSERNSYLNSCDSLAPHIASIESRSVSLDSDESPIFVLSAGWRSGSTLVQRLLMSNGQTLIWGEPYDRSCIIQRLAESLFSFSSDWPVSKYYSNPTDLDDLSKEWVANLYPPIACLKEGYRELIESLFLKPALERGASRWGLKEVRLSVRDAQFLQWLYPKAKFVFIYRDPFDAYSSYKSVSATRNWYSRWPQDHAFTPAAFGRHWRQLASDFQRNGHCVKGFVIKYEDLVSGQVDCEVLAQYCEIGIDKTILKIRVGGAAQRNPTANGLSRLESLLLSRFTAPVAAELGYHVGRKNGFAK